MTTWKERYLPAVMRHQGGESDILRVRDRKLMRSSPYAVTVLSQPGSEWLSVFAGDLSL